MKPILFILTIALLSCHSSKFSASTSATNDSTAVRQRDSILEEKRLDSAGYSNLIQALSENKIEFRDTGTTKIVFDTLTKFLTIEGPVKTIYQKDQSSQSQAAYWKHSYDSLASYHALDSLYVKTIVERVQVIKKKTVFPWYFWLICALPVFLWLREKYKLF